MNNLMCRTARAQYFLIGMMIGLLVGIFMIMLMPVDNNIRFAKHIRSFTSYDAKMADEEFQSELGDHNDTHHNILINASLADQLYKEEKVLCWILTGPKNHQSKAKYVKATWGKRCNHLLFMSTKEDPSLPSIALPVIEDRNHLWGKTKEALKYIYQNYFDKADWFFKADDDTYAIMENMRYMLHYHNTSDPVYFGFRFKPIVKQGYMSGGSGYVMGKEALKRFVMDALPDPKKCKKDNTGAEDAELGKCLEAVGIEAGDSRDTSGRSTFLPLFATDFIVPGNKSEKFWFWKYHYYPLEKGLECCSDSLISVHYVSPANMYLLEYLIYHVKAFGLSYNPTFDAIIFEDNRDTNKSTTKTESVARITTEKQKTT